MENNNFGFEEMELWKKSREFKNDVRLLTNQFPTDEKFRLTDQAIRSSRSINTLITEGHGRFTFTFTFPDQIHYCIQARGSLTETINHIIDAFDEKYITEEQLLIHKQKRKIYRTATEWLFKFSS